MVPSFLVLWLLLLLCCGYCCCPCGRWPVMKMMVQMPVRMDEAPMPMVVVVPVSWSRPVVVSMMVAWTCIAI
jgi:hypothetical protein